MTSFRKLNKLDDTALIVNGIYQTDKVLFDFLFKDREKAFEAIYKLINSKYSNEYHGSYITVIYDKDPKQIEGFIVAYSGREVSVESTYHAFEETKLTTISFLRNKFLNKFFASNIGVNDYYIGNLYVLDEFRNKGNGSKLVEKAKQKARQKNAKNVLLDVKYENKSLLDFYKKLGFKLDSKNYRKFLGKSYGCYGLKYEIDR